MFNFRNYWLCFMGYKSKLTFFESGYRVVVEVVKVAVGEIHLSWGERDSRSTCDVFNSPFPSISKLAKVLLVSNLQV